MNSEDVLQDVLLDAARAFQLGKGPQTTGGDGFFPWLARMIDNRIRHLARFHVSTECRTVLREVPLEASSTPAPNDGQGKTPSSLLMGLERTGELARILLDLTPKERELIELLYYRRVSVSEAALALGKTPGSTAVLHCETLKKLRAILRRKRELL